MKAETKHTNTAQVTCKPPYRISNHVCGPRLIGTDTAKAVEQCVVMAEIHGRTLEEEDAHADFILRACNSHAALLVACKRVLDRQPIGGLAEDVLLEPCDLDMLNAAIALAEKE